MITVPQITLQTARLFLSLVVLNRAGLNNFKT